MRLELPEHFRHNPFEWLRRQGYAVHHGRDGQVSAVRRVGGDAYPRYHVYVESPGGRMVINLHLDQKQPSYAGSAAHAGEYDGPLVEAEITRLRRGLSQGANVKTQTPAG